MKKQNDLNEKNYRSFARKCIAKYEAKGMVIDALVWSSIIGQYEAALEKAGIAEGKEPLP